MYHVTLKGDSLYRVTVSGYGENLSLVGRVEEGDTPMSLFVTALASCVTMCVQGYYARHLQEPDLAIEVSASYESQQFELQIRLPERLTEQREEALRRYIAQHCRVKQLLREDVTVTIHFIL